MPPKPDNYLVWSILMTVFCCLPLGIVALIKSTAVDSAYASGNYELANQNSQEAKKWNIISLIVGGVSYLLTIAMYVFIFAAAVGTNIGM